MIAAKTSVLTVLLATISRFQPAVVSVTVDPRNENYFDQFYEYTENEIYYDETDNQIYIDETGDGPTGEFDFTNHLQNLSAAAPTDIFLLKFSYRFSF